MNMYSEVYREKLLSEEEPVGIKGDVAVLKKMKQLVRSHLAVSGGLCAFNLIVAQTEP